MEDFCAATLADFKDIVQPKKRGVMSGTNQFISIWYTIADTVFSVLFHTGKGGRGEPVKRLEGR